MAIIGRSICCAFREPIPALCKPHAVRYALKGICKTVCVGVCVCIYIYIYIYIYIWRVLNVKKGFISLVLNPAFCVRPLIDRYCVL